MAERNVEIVRGLQPSEIDFVAAVEDGAPFAGLPGAAFADDFESEWIAPDGLRLGPFRGVDGFIAGWRDWLETFDRYELRVEDMIGVGDHVVAFVHVSARTRRDGVEMTHAPAAIWTLRDGVICRIAFYLDRNEALAAVGRR